MTEPEKNTGLKNRFEVKKPVWIFEPVHSSTNPCKREMNERSKTSPMIAVQRSTATGFCLNHRDRQTEREREGEREREREKERVGGGGVESDRQRERESGRRGDGGGMGTDAFAHRRLDKQ